MPEFVNEKTIDELQGELKNGLGTSEPLKDKSLEDVLPEDTDPDQEDILDKTVKVEDEKTEEETPPTKETKKEDIIRQRSQERAQKRNAKYQEMAKEISELKETVNQFLNKGKQEEANQELVEYATKHNLDPDGIQSLVNIIEKRVGKVEPKEVQPTAKTDDVEKYDETVDPEIFQEEWDEFMPKIEEQYPHASASQIREAEKLMEDLAHKDPKLATYDLEDIFNSPKYQQQFKDLLFSPKKKTFEAGRTVDRGTLEENFDFDNAQIDTPDAARKMKERLWKMSQGKTRLHSVNGQVTEI